MRIFCEGNANRASNSGCIPPGNLESNPKNPIIAAFLGILGMRISLTRGVAICLNIANIILGRSCRL